MNAVISESGMNKSRLVGAYLGDIRYELVKMLRTPAFAVPTLLFPAMFYMIFGVLMGSARGNVETAKYAFAGLSVFGTMAPGLFGFGVSLAFEREYGTLTFKQALPMPAGSYLLARMVMAMLFATIISLLLITLALFAGHVPLTVSQTVEMYLVCVLGVLPFCAVGLFVGASVSGQAAPAIVNIIYLPMSFLSGLWFPVGNIAHVLEQLAPIWPSYHLGQLAHGALDQPTLGTSATHVMALAGFTLVFFTLAVRKLSSGGVRMFGGSKAAGGAPLGRALVNGLLFLGVAFIVTGVLRGNDPVRKSETAATSNGTSDAHASSAATDAGASAGPVGVAAPGDPLVADFDHGSDKATYGEGWFADGDANQGGKSVATESVVDGGAEGTRSSLEVKGTLNAGAFYPSAGTLFFPNGTENGKTMDLSGKHALRFWARGDGRSCFVIFIDAEFRPGVIPPMKPFTPGNEWTEVRVPLNELGPFDLKRVRLITVRASGANGALGDFKFQIDNVRIE